MNQEKEIMKALGEDAGFLFRLGIFLGGILGLFFPGWYMYRNMQLYKTMEDNPAFQHIHSMIEKVNLTPERQNASNDN